MNVKNFQKVPQLMGQDNEDTTLLLNMADEAVSYIKNFTWCPPIKTVYLAQGVGGIIGIFFIEFSHKIQSADDHALWVVVGDIPSAYLVVEENDSAKQVLERYCLLMDEWILAVRNNGDLTQVYPVNAPPTIENANQLKERIDIFRKELILN